MINTTSRTVQVNGANVPVKLRRGGMDVRKSDDEDLTSTGPKFNPMPLKGVQVTGGRPQRVYYITMAGLSPTNPQTWPAKVYAANPELWVDSPEDARELAKTEWPSKSKFITLRKVEREGKVIVEHGRVDQGRQDDQRYKVDAMEWRPVWEWSADAAKAGQAVFEDSKKRGGAPRGKLVESLQASLQKAVILGKGAREAKRQAREAAKRSEAHVATMDAAVDDWAAGFRSMVQEEAAGVVRAELAAQPTTTPHVPATYTDRIARIRSNLTTPAVVLMTGHKPTEDEVMGLVMERGLVALERELGLAA